MTAKEFSAIHMITNLGAEIKLNLDYIYIMFQSKHNDVEIEIPIEYKDNFDLYVVLRKGIADNIYQLQPYTEIEIVEFREQLENLL